MKIRTQLLGLGLGSQLLIVLAIAAYFVILSPIGQFEAETVSIHAAARQALALQIATNKLALLGIETQKPVFDAAFQSYSGAVDATGKISKLLSINETMRNAVDSVRRLKEMSTDAIGLVTANLTDLRADIKDLGTKAVDLDFATILQTVDEGKYSADQKDTVHYHVNAAVANLKSCDEILTSTVTIIEEKDHIIASEIGAIRTASTFAATGILALVLVSVVLFSLLLATAIARSMQVLSRNVAIAATGDLTQRFQLKRNDEIGGLGNDLNNLLVEFNRILGRIQEASRQNELLCEDFVKIVSESSSSAVQIEVNTEAIRSQLVKMDTMVATAEGQAGGIAATLKEFHGRLALQDHHVSETVSAVTKMLEAIENIAVITERDSRSAGHMLEETKRSWAVFDQASQTMSDISESVVLIQEMTSVISGLSGQTNILAINAAIEAAHAGEYGKSFAVVADEIGTLATAAAVSSQEIATNVATVVVKMNAARSAQTATSEAFVRISTDIAEVTRSISEIHDNISGLQSGSRQVLGSMEILGTTSSEVTGKAGFIDKTALSLKEAMTDLTGISHEVTTNIGEIASGIQLITASIRGVSERTSRLEGIGDELNSAVSVFKTADA